MAVFVLVHGGAHGAWCWDKVVPELQRLGHRVAAPDLAGMGQDRTPLSEVSLRGWAADIAAIARAAGEPVVLVGHSRGGPVISEGAERAPEAVHGLIYLSAVMTPAGISTMDAFANTAQHLLENSTMTADGLAIVFDREVARKCFYHRASPEDAEAALNRLCPEPVAPNREPMSITPERWGRLPRAFIECSDDRALSLSLQRRMHSAMKCDPVLTLDSDHSPFLCAPRELAGWLDKVGVDFAHRARSK
jgi:pimeloyl-ACP methyl ester carboxylesterase